MKLFIVDSIPLRTLADRPDGPRLGDVVAFWRHAQDIDGSATAILQERGVTVEWAEARIGDDDIIAIDDFINRFGKNWPSVDGIDHTTSDEFSFAEALTSKLHSRARINLLVRYGHIFEDLFVAYSEVREILTDFVDGVNWLNGDTPIRGAFPRRRLLGDRAMQRGIPCRDMQIDKPLPPLGYHGHQPTYTPMIRALIGGIRPCYLWGRLRLRYRKKKHPRIYIFMTEGLGKVAETLAHQSKFVVLGDWQGYSQVIPFRYDHLIALPRLCDIRAIRQLRCLVKVRRRTGYPDGLARYGSIDFTPYFSESIALFFKQIWLPTLIAKAQAQRMLEISLPDMVVINGEGSVMARLAVALSRKFGYKIAFIDHSDTLVPYGYHPHGRNFPHVIYVAQGDDHVDAYGAKLPEDKKPYRPVLTTAATTVMAPLRNRYRRPPKKRILLINYSPAMGYTIARTPYGDRYVIELFEAARRLTAEGYEFTYREHPGYKNSAHIDYLLTEMNLKQAISLDSVKSFSDSLSKHDLLVSNVSGCLYQFLYAGWPTVFYEPNYKPRNFVGLLAASDIEQPIASTPEELIQMIRDGVTNPQSLTARFPQLFNTVYAHRFIGRDADHADEVLANFLADELSNKSTLSTFAVDTYRGDAAAE